MHITCTADNQPLLDTTLLDLQYSDIDGEGGEMNFVLLHAETVPHRDYAHVRDLG